MPNWKTIAFYKFRANDDFVVKHDNSLSHHCPSRYYLERIRRVRSNLSRCLGECTIYFP